MIEHLIDPTMSLHLVRDRIGEILITECESQKQLATAGGKEPRLWDYRVFAQQRDPIDCYTHTPRNGTPDARPILNVAISGETLTEKGGSVRQLINPYNAEYFVTAFGYGIAQETSEGHKPAEDVALEHAERTIGLARAILLADPYRYLVTKVNDPVRKLVRSRKNTNLRYEQVSIGEGHTFFIQAITMNLIVDLDEVVRERSSTPLDAILINVRRADNGELFLLQHEVDTTPTP
jgi:hypothetical protein